MVLSRCEQGHDNYSLRVVSLRKAPSEPGRRTWPGPCEPDALAGVAPAIRRLLGRCGTFFGSRRRLVSHNCRA